MTDRSHEERNAAATARLKTLVARLSDEDLAHDADDGWTIAAGLAHMALWDRTVAVRWSSALASDSLPIGVPFEISHVINDASVPLWRALPVRTAAELSIAAADETDAVIARLADATLDAVVAAGVPRMVDRSLHRNAHMDDLERALAAAVE